VIKDFSYTEDCDFYLTKEKTIKITNDDKNNERKIQGIIKRLQSSSNDYVAFNYYNPYSLNLKSLIGKPINEDTIQVLQRLITQMLTADGLVPMDKIYFNSSKISKTEVYIVLNITFDSVLPTKIGLMYDTRNTFIVPRVLKVYK